MPLADVAAATAATIRKEPSRKRHQKRFGFGASVPSPSGGGLRNTGSTTIAQASIRSGSECRKASSDCL